MYTIEKSTNNMSLRIGILYGKLELLIANSTWKNEFEELIKYQASISAVTTDKNIFNKLPVQTVPSKKMIIELLGEDKYEEYIHYKKALEELVPKLKVPFTIESIKDLHHQILPQDEFTFRKNAKLLPKQIRVNNIIKEVNLEVRTKPHEIVGKLNKFFQWFNKDYPNENPVVLAALAHLEIAQIHPFSDGNGRLSNIMGNVGFASNGIFTKKFFAIEYFLLQNIEIYYEILEETVETGDQTKWISFYTEALLGSLINAADLIKNITYGAVDVEENKHIELTELETKTMQIITVKPNIKMTDLAVELNCSRQNVYRIINKLKELNLILD